MLSKQLRNFLKNKSIFITGAAGSVGSELARQIYRIGCKKLCLLDNNETGLFDIWEELPEAEPILADIRKRERLKQVFNEKKPDIVFHTAAYKHIVMGEKFPCEIIRTNINGFLNVVACSRQFKTEKVVFISTDKAVNPQSIMGLTKALGERLCLIYNSWKPTRFIAVRFANVLGSRGSVIPIWQKQMDEGKYLTVTDKRMERYFMTMEEACQLILEAAYLGKGGETFVLDMGKSVKILDLAKEIIIKSGKKVGIKIIGAKPGEKFKEELMTEEERKRAIKRGKLWIIK
uniref:NAD-dependent epimerase/dehydratase family protein n=1 Tax=candidate division CPR3 bacterium TaxID=2268181 RepID=A0A7V3N6C0_UNCC3